MLKSAPVSAIIPCFNCEATIGRAIESIISQTLSPEELILVNDASEDGSLTVLKYYETLYPNWIKVIDLRSNVGAASARNIGWKISSCPYIAFLDADDSWHPQKIEIQYSFMKKNVEADVVGHLVCRATNDNYNSLNINSNNFKIRKVNATSLLFKNYFSTPCVMVKSGLDFKFEEHKRHSEDLFLWQNLAFDGANLVRIEINLAFIHKSVFSDHGLNSQLWKMESGELMNLLTHFKNNKINFFTFVLCVIYSLTKFIVRLLIISKNKIL